MQTEFSSFVYGIAKIGATKIEKKEGYKTTNSPIRWDMMFE